VEEFRYFINNLIPTDCCVVGDLSNVVSSEFLLRDSALSLFGTLVEAHQWFAGKWLLPMVIGRNTQGYDFQQRLS
jgi:hypothetical protein